VRRFRECIVASMAVSSSYELDELSVLDVEGGGGGAITAEL